MAYAYTCDVCKTSFIIEDLTNIQESKNVEHCPFCYRGTKRHLHFSGATGDEESRYKITLKDSNNLKVGESIMVDSKIKNLSLYGTGYAFESGKDVDLSKFNFNDGYMLFIQHFGYIDPLLGELEGPFWYDAVDSAKYILDKFQVSEEWLNWYNENYKENFKDVTDALEQAIGRDPSSSIAGSPVIKNKFIIKDYYNTDVTAVFGINDFDYFYDTVVGYLKNFFDLEEKEVTEILRESEVSDKDSVLIIQLG